MQKSKLQQALESLDYVCQEYSGRCMYGKKCLGVQIESGQSIFELGYQVSEWMRDNDEFLKDRDMKPSEDSFGLGQIIYWPNVAYSEE